MLCLRGDAVRLPAVLVGTTEQSRAENSEVLREEWRSGGVEE